MKLSELKRIIREEISGIVSEGNFNPNKYRIKYHVGGNDTTMTVRTTQAINIRTNEGYTYSDYNKTNPECAYYKNGKYIESYTRGGKKVPATMKDIFVYLKKMHNKHYYKK